MLGTMYYIVHCLYVIRKILTYFIKSSNNLIFQMENWGLRASHLIKLTQSQAPDQGRVCVLDHHTVLHCKERCILSLLQRYQCSVISAQKGDGSVLFSSAGPRVCSVSSARVPALPTGCSRNNSGMITLKDVKLLLN